MREEYLSNNLSWGQEDVEEAKVRNQTGGRFWKLTAGNVECSPITLYISNGSLDGSISSRWS